MIHKEILREDTKKLLDSLNINSQFYLAGGTGLALQLGHRQSEDLDFFSERDFDVNELESYLRDNHNLENAQVIGNHTLIGICDNVKISFMKFNYPLLEGFIDYSNLHIASIEDITAMKLNAIARRNTKKDFVDLYYIIKNENYSIDDLINILKAKFAEISLSHVFYSLTYFAEADNNPEVIWMEGFSVGWDKIKEFFLKYVPKDIANY